MSDALRFASECALVAVMAGTTTAALVALLHRLLRRRLERLPPSPRTDLLQFLCLLPGVMAAVVPAAAVLPSVLAALGVAADHCGEHLHHPHLCIVHGATYAGLRLFAGVVALSFLTFTVVQLLHRILGRRRRLSALEALGRRARDVEGGFPVLLIPGAPRLCHAAGVFRRRVLVSESLARGLDGAHLAAALAHEDTHHAQRDGLSSALMLLAGVFYPSALLSRALEHTRAAMEERCDAAAARRLGDARQVAQAIVSMARLQVDATPYPNGFTGASLERRVRRLLDDPSDRPTFGVRGVLTALAVVSVALLVASDGVHHGVETLLHLF